jgi:dihydrolipoamide dehydrogenase
MGKELLKIAKKLGMEVYLGHKVTSLENKGKEVALKAEDKSGKIIELKGDYCLVSIGRKPYTDGLGLDKIGIETVKGQISVDDHLKTKVDNIYAIGDVVRGAMLAHKAEEEGVMVAEQLAGQKPHINYLLIPGVVYTWPEVASVGYTEEQLKQAGRAYKVGNFPYKALGRARASMDTDGLVKILAEKSTDEILGVHIIGARAADMIAAGVTAMEFRASAEDVSRMSHAHPTYMEAFKEACLAATANRPIHM